MVPETLLLRIVHLSQDLHISSVHQPPKATISGEMWIQTLSCTLQSAGELSNAEARAGEIVQPF